jgi:hypothetical protein
VKALVTEGTAYRDEIAEIAEIASILILILIPITHTDDTDTDTDVSLSTQAVKALVTEGTAYRDEIAEIASDFQTFQKCVKTYAANQGPPLESWFHESQSGMEALVEQNKDLQKVRAS